MRKLSTQQFIQKAILVHGDKYDYSNVIYLGFYIKIIIICPEHGEFLQSPSDHLSGCGCKTCRDDKMSLARVSNLQQFIEKAIIIHSDKNDYSNSLYINARTKLCITCLANNHGDYWQTPNNHLRGKGCPKCHLETIGKWNTSNLEEFIKKAIARHGDKYNYDLSLYNRDNIKLKIKCNKCNIIFTQTPNSHLQGAGCPSCSSSKGELALEAIFKKHNIEAEPQYNIPEIVANYEIDFYLPKYRLLIEFHGRQHYEYIPFFHDGDYTFEDQKTRDEMVRDAAVRWKYGYLELNYKQLKELSKDQFEELVLSNVK